MPRRLRIAVIDLVTRAPTKGLWSRVMNPNFAGIMPQVIAVWCERAGHDVRYVCYTGLEDLAVELPTDDLDLVFIATFTQSAQLSYALSNMYRSKGVVTALGGPHARCYPQDARRHYDYVFGFTDESLLLGALADCSQHRPNGIFLSRRGQPVGLPSVRERWKYIALTLDKAPVLKIVPMLSSLGCPYTCGFCIDATIPYAAMDFQGITDDLKFLRQKMAKPRVSWHDPNFGVRFDEIMDAIEAAAPNGEVQFLAESSLSLLSEPHLQRMRKNGVMAVLPGIESWFDLGGKSRTGVKNGMDKVTHVSEHVKMILRYIPYVQTNFVLGLDDASGDEPWSLTKRFIDMTPGAFPGYSLLTAFGLASPENAQYLEKGRVLPFPFHFLNNNNAMNVRPKNYGWVEFYDRLIDLTDYTFSWSVMARRMKAATASIPRYLNLVRGVSSEGFGRLRFYREVRRLLVEDKAFRAYFEQDTKELPAFFHERLKKDLGPMWEWLPKGAVDHDLADLLEPVVPQNDVIGIS